MSYQKISAPKNRVYKSSIPIKQQRLSSPPKKRLSYGKSTTKRLPKQDNTLTQMDYVTLHQPAGAEDDYLDAEMKRQLSPVPGLEVETRERYRTSRKVEDHDLNFGSVQDNKEARGSKRRKTTGNSSRSPNLHTQTLTQLDWTSSFAESNDSEQAVLGTGTSSSKMSNTTSGTRLKVRRDVSEFSLRSISAPGKLATPQTPRRRNMTLEIPSSQSPATPGSSAKRKPLASLSINKPIPFSVPKSKSSFTPPKLEVKDTYDTDSQLTKTANSSPKISSPAKSVRFLLLEDSSPGKSPESQSTKPSSLPSEICDSDADSDLDCEDSGNNEDNRLPPNEDLPGALDRPQLAAWDAEQKAQGELNSETCYGDIGLETQQQAEMEIDKIAFSSPPEDSEQVTTRSESTRLNVESQRLSTQHVKQMEARTLESDVFIAVHPSYVQNVLSGAKNHEFRNWAFPSSVRRLWLYETAPRSMLNYMAAIGPAKQAGDIVDGPGIGNENFNAHATGISKFAYEILDFYELSDPVTLAQLKDREWIRQAPRKMEYVKPAPLDELMANLRPAIFTHLQPSEEPQSSVTDTQECSDQLASTIKQFTQAENLSYLTTTSPIRRNDTQQGDPSIISSSIDDTPRCLPRFVASQVLPTHFGHDTEQPQASSIPPSKSSAMFQSSTEKVSSFPVPPSQATTVDLSQFQSQDQVLPEVVCESPTRPVDSTPAYTSQRRTQRSDSIAPLPFTLKSSQFLTRSQMAPDSLLNDSLSLPMFVPDSEDDYDDDDDDEELYGLDNEIGPAIGVLDGLG